MAIDTSQISRYFSDYLNSIAQTGIPPEEIFGSRVEVPVFDRQPPQASYQRINIPGILQDVSAQNVEGLGRASQMSRQTNRQLLEDVLVGLSSLYGDGAFQRQRDLVNRNIESNLRGQISPGAQAILSRQALSTGNTALGRGAVNSAYSGFLGLTSEDLSQRGFQNFNTLFNTYRNAIPLSSPTDFASYFTLNPAQAVQSSLYDSLNAFEANKFNANMISNYDQLRYENAYAQAVAAAQPNPAIRGLFQDSMALLARDQALLQQEETLNRYGVNPGTVGYNAGAAQQRESGGGGFLRGLARVAAPVLGGLVGGPVGAAVGGAVGSFIGGASPSQVGASVGSSAVNLLSRMTQGRTGNAPALTYPATSYGY